MADNVTRLDWERANTLVHGAEKILIVTHQRPDGDAIGSMVGLGLALREHGKQVTMAVDDGVPRLFRFLDGTQDVLPRLTDTPDVDLVITTDASSPDRVGVVGAVALGLGKPVIVIDHHATNTFFGDAHILQSDYVSTTEAVLRWLDQLGWEPSPQVARALLTGLMTDTIGFRVGPVAPDTMLIANRLMQTGIDIREVALRTLGTVESGMLQLMGAGLMRAKLEDHVIWTWLTLDDLKAYNFQSDRKPELASEMLQDEQAWISAYFTETEEGDVRLSLRAVPGFDVGSIAFSLGGGGHTLAAGCTLEQTTIEAAIEKVVPLLKTESRSKQPQYE